MRKYKQENLWESTEGTVVLIRLSEMYYILAECAATPEEAAEFLNKVRSMRGLIRLFVQKLTDWMRLKKSTVKNFTGRGNCFSFINVMLTRHFYIAP